MIAVEATIPELVALCLSCFSIGISVTVLAQVRFKAKLRRGDDS